MHQKQAFQSLNAPFSPVVIPSVIQEQDKSVCAASEILSINSSVRISAADVTIMLLKGANVEIRCGGGTLDFPDAHYKNEVSAASKFFMHVDRYIPYNYNAIVKAARN